MWKTELHRSPSPSVYQLANLAGLSAMIMLLAVSCADISTSRNDDPLADRSFITGEPCAAPCWQNLELNEANETEVLDKLKTLSFVDAETVYTYTASWLGDNAAIAVAFDCTHPAEENCGLARVSKDKLKSLILSVGYDLTLEDVVSKLGPPAYIDYGPIHVDIGGCIVDLFWPGRNVIATSRNTKEVALCSNIEAGKPISPTVLITELSYTVDEGFGPAPAGCCKRVPWPGFVNP